MPHPPKFCQTHNCNKMAITSLHFCETHSWTTQEDNDTIEYLTPPNHYNRLQNIVPIIKVKKVSRTTRRKQVIKFVKHQLQIIRS